MGHMNGQAVVRRVVTVVILVTLLVTTFVPNWWDHAASAAVPADTDAVITAAEDVPVLANRSAARTSEFAPEPLAALNALVLGEAGQSNALVATIEATGGHVYVRAGDALFVGLKELDYNSLAPVGARAVYDGWVDEAARAGLSASDGALVDVWNSFLTDAPVAANPAAIVPGLATSIAVVNDSEPAGRSASTLAAPSATQTSVFLAGSVTVEVVFVESYDAATGNNFAETWTDQEIQKVKAEVASALEWWTVAATAPAAVGEPPRPSAQLSWNVNYYSPRDPVMAPKVAIDRDPILTSVFDAADTWMQEIAARFTLDPGDSPSSSAIRTWADEARKRPGQETDWAFVLFVVDSSVDVDGRFDVDQKIGGAALNGPWAVVTYDGGDELGSSNLEVLIAKMIGHVFGAGDESYDSLLLEGCSPDEVYGYLRIPHDNCDFNDTAVPSLMLDGADMVSAYAQHQLSDAARAQVGWRDSDDDGLYDVIDTLADSFTGFGGDVVCPTLHLTTPQITNAPALPTNFGSGSPSGWSATVWNPNANNGFGALEDVLSYTPVNINWPSYVWGRVNNGEWVPGEPVDGVWDSQDEGYMLRLPATPGALNTVEVAIMNRWKAPGYMTDPADPHYATIKVPPSTGSFETSSGATPVDFFQPNGEFGGWDSITGGGYSNGDTMKVDAGAGYEACFAFDGREVSLIHTASVGWGTANVYVDGELHSTIDYGVQNANQVNHLVTNLSAGVHEVSIIGSGGTMDFDAFNLTSTAGNPLTVIDRLTDVDADGFYENSGNKLLYTGGWYSIDLVAERPGTPDGFAHRNARPLDRANFHVKNADTIGIYRHVYPGGGSADVYLDGELLGTMYNNAKTDMVVPFYISGIADPASVHSISVRVNGDAPAFDLESVRLLAMAGDPSLYTAYEPGAGEYVSAPRTVAFNGAQEAAGWRSAYNVRMETTDDGALQTVFFQGSAIAVLRNTGGHGLMELYVDGKLVRTLDNLKGRANAAPATIHGLDPTIPHVLQIRHLNANPARPKINRVWGFEVYKINPVPLGEYEEYTYDAANQPVQSNFIYEQAWRAITRTRLPTASGNHWIESRHEESIAYFYFTGANALTVYGNSSGGYGAADVYVNGELAGVFYQKGRGGYGRPYTVTGFDKNATNVLELRVHIERGFRKKFNIDKVRTYNMPVLEPVSLTESRFYENDEEVPLTEGGTGPAMAFSGLWQLEENASASGLTYHEVNSIYDEVTFEVKNAASVVVYRRLWRPYGKADVYVDGVYHSSFDNYFNARSDPYGLFNQPYVIAGLDPGFQHRISIKPQPFGRKLNRYKRFTIDRVEVRGQNTSSGAGMTYLHQGVQGGVYDNTYADATAPVGTAIQYVGSSWNHSMGYSESRNRGERAVVMFSGNAFTVFFNKFVGGGIASVYVDGRLIGDYRLGTRTPVNHIPFSIGGLEDRLHTAEIIVKSGIVQIDGYRVYSRAPAVYDSSAGFSGANTFDFVRGVVNPDDNMIISGEWIAVGDYLRTKERYASLYFYTTNGRALFLTREMLARSGQIEIYIDGEQVTMVDTSYLNTWLNQGILEEELAVGSLDFMLSKPVWVEIRNRQPRWISLKSLRMGALDQYVLGPGASVEAEDVLPAGNSVAGMRASGGWVQQPGRPQPANYSNSYFLLSRNEFSRFYISVQDVDYVQVYRRTGGAGDIDVYIDGEYWGMIPSRGGRNVPSAAFAIGPIPNPGNKHVIELRQNHPRVKIGIDKIETFNMNVLQPGVYDDNALVGGNPAFLYFGVWYEIPDENAAGGAYMRGTARGDRLATVFEGNKLTIYRKASRASHYADVYIDGVKYPMYSWSRTNEYSHGYTILLPDEGPHTLEIVNSRGRLEFDGIEVGSAVPAGFGAYQENDSLVVANGLDLGHWETVMADENSGGSFIYTRKRFTSVFFMFTGQRITVYSNSGGMYSKASMYIDGQLVEDVNMWQRTTRADPQIPFFAWDYTGLSAGTHVLEIRTEGKRDRRQGRGWINLDAITVDGAPVPTPGGTVGPVTPNVGGQPPVITAPTQGCFEETNRWIFHPNADPELDPGTYVWSMYYPVDKGASMDKAFQSAAYDPSKNLELSAEFTFAAEGFALLYHKTGTAGNMAVWLDGTQIDTLTLTGADSWLDQAKYEVSGLDPNVEHTLKLVHLGPTGTRIYIDRLDLPAYNSIYNDNCVP